MTDMIVIDSGETGRLVIGWIAPLEEKIIDSAVWLTVWIFAFSYWALKRVLGSVCLLYRKGICSNGKSCSMRRRQPMSPLMQNQSKKDSQRLQGSQLRGPGRNPFFLLCSKRFRFQFFCFVLSRKLRVNLLWFGCRLPLYCSIDRPHLLDS